MAHTDRLTSMVSVTLTVGHDPTTISTITLHPVQYYTTNIIDISWHSGDVDNE